MTYYGHMEIEIVQLVECQQCKASWRADVTIYKGVKYWDCPKCKTKNEMKLDV